MDNIKIINLSAEYVKPEIKEYNNREWVQNGRDNSYYQYVNDRRMGSPTNAAIINNYIKLIYGLGLEDTNGLDTSDYIDKDELKRIINDFYEQGMAYLQITKKRDGSLDKIYHGEVDKFCPEKVNDDNEIEGYYFSRDWKNWRKEKNNPVRYPAFGLGKRNETEILCIKPYKMGQEYFATPSYQAGLQYCQIEEEISNFSLSHIQRGFSAGYIISIPNAGNFTQEDKDIIERKVKAKLTGSSAAGSVILDFMVGDQQVKVEVIQVNSSHKQWETLRDQARDQILTAHEVVSPLLFGIRVATGFSSNADEMDMAEAQTMKRVIRPIQEYITDSLQLVFEAFGMETDLYFVPLTELNEEGDNVDEDGAVVDEDNTDEEEVAPRWKYYASGKAVGKATKVFDSASAANSYRESKGKGVVIQASKQDAPNGIADALITLGEVEDLTDWEIVETRAVDGVPKDIQRELKLNLARAITSQPTIKSEQDTSLFRVRYVYAGNADPEREFCAKMMKANRVYRKEDIDFVEDVAVNPGLGIKGADTYPIWLYKGGVNCKHFWERRIYLRRNNKRITVNEARKMILELDPQDRDAAKWEQNEKEVAQIASESNNHWRYTLSNLFKFRKGYDPNQPRDESGRWTDDEVSVLRSKNRFGAEIGSLVDSNADRVLEQTMGRRVYDIRKEATKEELDRAIETLQDQYDRGKDFKDAETLRMELLTIKKLKAIRNGDTSYFDR
jgi:hypothetical protein